MLDDIIDEVKVLKLPSKDAIVNELIRRLKILNCVSPSAEDRYREAIYREYEVGPAP